MKLADQSIKVPRDSHNIGSHTNELVTHTYKFIQLIDAAGCTCELAMLPCHLRYPFPCIQQPWMIPLPGSPDTLAEIAGSEEQHIKSIQGCNLIQLFQWFRIFNLEDDKPVPVSLFEICIKIKVRIRAIRIASIYCAQTKWVKTGMTNNVFCILNTHHMRNHNSCRIHFKWLNQVAITTPWHPNQSISIISFC